MAASWKRMECMHINTTPHHAQTFSPMLFNDALRKHCTGNAGPALKEFCCNRCQGNRSEKKMKMIRLFFCVCVSRKTRQRVWLCCLQPVTLHLQQRHHSSSTLSSEHMFHLPRINLTHLQIILSCLVPWEATAEKKIFWLPNCALAAALDTDL